MECLGGTMGSVGTDMPKKKRPGRTGVYVELPDDLDRRFRKYVKARGSTVTVELRLAVERHITYPPPKVPPFPPDSPAP
jgi:hypothetical protein